MATLTLEARRAALRGSTLFHRLEPADIDAVLTQAQVKRAARGEFLVRRGQPSGSVLVIVVGRVRVGLVSEGGREVTVGMLGPGDVLGEMSVLDGEEASADAMAIDECVLLAIERSRFLHLLRSNGELCLRLMTVLCQRLRRSNAALEDMALLDLPARLARLLARLARDYGVRTEGGTRIQVKLSQNDLGAMIGASREKVNKSLRKWEEDGILGKEAGYLVVIRSGALLNVARAEAGSEPSEG